MADDYIITAKIVAQDIVSPATDSAQKKIEGIERSAERAGMSITSILSGAFAALGGSYALRQAVSWVIDLNSSIEEATFGMASLFSATTGMGIADSLGLAREQVQGLREDAAVGVGELENYLEGFQMLLAPVLQAGGTTDMVRSLTKNALAAGFALRGQEGLRLAPMDIQQALTQGLGDRTTPIAMAAVRAMGMSSEKFNALDTAKKIEVLGEAFGKFAPGVELMGKSWSAQMSTFRDGVSETVRAVTRPLFDRWSQGLQDVNKWLSASKEDLADIADRIAPKLVASWDLLAGHTKEISAALLGIGAAAGVGGFMAAGGFGALAAGLATAATFAAPLVLVAGAVGVAALSLFAAWETYPETLGRVQGGVESLSDSFDRILGAFDTSSGDGGAFAQIGKVFSDWIVTPFLENLSDMASGLALTLVLFDEFARGILDLYGIMLSVLTGEVSYKDVLRLADRAIAEGDQRIKTRVGALLPKTDADEEHRSGGAKFGTDGAGLVVANTTIKVDKIEIKTEKMDDPAAVASAFETFLHTVNRHRRVPLRDPFPSPVGS
jgi:hypothetical protein